MSRIMIFMALTLALAPPALAQQTSQFSDAVKQYISHSAPALLITNAHLIDGSGIAVSGLQDVAIIDGRIASVTPAGQQAPNEQAEIIDGSGKTLMPGLVMVHEHLFYNDHKREAMLPHYMSEAPTFAALYLAHGITSARTGGTMNITDDLAIKKAVDGGRHLGPKLHLTTPYIEGPGSFAYQMPVPADAQEVREFVRYWASQGVTSIKAYVKVSREVLAAAIDEAHKQGMQATGHLCSVTYHEAAAMGIDNLEHGFLVATDFVADKVPDQCPDGATAALLAVDPAGEEAQALFKHLISNNVTVTSTLAVFAAGTRDYLPSPGAMDLMAERTRALNQEYLKNFGPEGQQRSGIEKSVAGAMALERAFAAAGGRLVAGTDPTGWGATIPGPGS